MAELGFEHLEHDHGIWFFNFYPISDSTNYIVLDFETSSLIAAEFNFEPMVDDMEVKDLLPA